MEEKQRKNRKICADRGETLPVVNVVILDA